MNETKYVYSALPSLLLKQRMTVADLYKRLEAGGRHFDRKAVYRLASHEPLQTLNMPLVGAVCEELELDLQHLISLGEPASKLARIDAATQDRLDELMTRNTEGKLKAAELRELEKLRTKSNGCPWKTPDYSHAMAAPHRQRSVCGNPGRSSLHDPEAASADRTPR